MLIRILQKRLPTPAFNQAHVLNSAATFIWVAVLERMFWRYTERGYRYLHLDAGHVCQNLALGAEQVGCGICPIAKFDDEQLEPGAWIGRRKVVRGLHGEPGEKGALKWD